MNQYILDESGEPVAEPDLIKWGKWMQDVGAGRQIARDKFDGGVLVSTVFLGLDHNVQNSGPPILYETMVFGGPLDEEMERYATKAEALEGHKRMCERAKRPKRRILLDEDA